MKKSIIAVVCFTAVFCLPGISVPENYHLADKYWDMAVALKDKGEGLKAAEMYEKSADAEKKSPSPRMDYAAVALNEAGACYYLTAHYDKAIRQYQEAMEINRQLKKEDQVAIQMNNIGLVFFAWGRYDKAIENYEKALDIHNRLGYEAEAAVALNNIGGVYSAWGRREQALEYFYKALEIDQRLGNEAEVAIRLNNIGEVYFHLEQPNRALKSFRQALAINNRLGKEAQAALQLNNIGEIFRSRGQYDEAMARYEKALEINRRFGREVEVAGNLNNISMIYKARGQYDKAIKYFKKTVRINKRLNRTVQLAAGFDNIGISYFSIQQYDKAAKNFLQAVKIKETLRKTATGEARRDYLTDQIYTYQRLISSFVLNNEISKAFSAIELSRAKLLSEYLADGRQDIFISVEDIQGSLPADTAIITWANINSFFPVVQVVITKENLYGREVPVGDFLYAVKAEFKKQIDALLKSQRGLKIAKREKQQEAIRIDPIDFDDVINYYRSLITTTPNSTGRGLKVSGTLETVGNRVPRLERMLYDFLIKPVEKHIEDKTKLILIPDGILGYLPFETLRSKDRAYLVEKFDINYVQSIGVLERIRRRVYGADRKPLLAFGDAVYDEITYWVDTIKEEKELHKLLQVVAASIPENRSMRSAYASLDLAGWSNLPGTLKEVINIKKVVQGSRIHVGRKVTEERIKALSAGGELAEYRVLHFATHGLVVPEIPELSAIVLSQFKKELGGEDGYLRMGEIVKLNLKADFVNLSACETGIGKIYGGEGVVGLTQSFLIAGANALSVSLWQVADDSTAQFMIALYESVQKENIGYDEAMNKVKRSFIKGEFGDKHRSPYYWAPFVYYGLPTK